MKIIPTAPTDNLYKFMAIFGLWLSFFLVVILGWLAYASHQVALEAKATQGYYLSQNEDRKVMSRMKAITEGRLQDDKLDLTQGFDTPSFEMKFLKAVHANHQQAMKNAEPLLNRHTGEIFEALEAMGIKWILPTYTGFCIMIALAGFQQWYRRIQQPADKLVPIEFKIKETELQLKEAELRQKQTEARLKEAELRRITCEENVTGAVVSEPPLEAPGPLREAA